MTDRFLARFILKYFPKRFAKRLFNDRIKIKFLDEV